MKSTSLLFLITIVSLLQLASPAKILVLYLFGSKSHKNFAKPIINELASRGHDIVFVSAFKESKQVPGIREIIVNTTMESFSGMRSNMFELKKEGTKGQLAPMLSMFSSMEEISERVFETPEIQELINSNANFDLAMVSGFANDFAYGWLHKLQVPTVMLFPGMPISYMLDFVGSPFTMANIDNIFFGQPTGMTFLQRTGNVAVMLALSVLRDYVLNPMFDNIVQKRFPGSPGVHEMAKNFSLLIINTHLSINGPRPYVPAIVEAGGAHCKPAKPLPKDLAEFVDGSGEHGFILFSFGSVVQGSQMPDEYKDIFLQVFSELPQRVLWKWETEEMDKVPPNVRLSKWLPQQDLLGHPKCRAFITHGGLLSTQEAIYHGVPVIGIPFFGDQSMNIEKAEHRGYAIKLDLLSMTADNLLDSLKRIIHDPKYKTKVNYLSSIFRDQPDSALERAVYWVEYVIRHKGAPHLKPEAAQHHWSQNLLIDILAFLAFLFAACLTVVLLFVFLIFKICCKILCGKKTSANDKKKKQ